MAQCMENETLAFPPTPQSDNQITKHSKIDSHVGRVLSNSLLAVFHKSMKGLYDALFRPIESEYLFHLWVLKNNKVSHSLESLFGFGL